MHIESSITAVSWIPVGSVTGLARVPFSLGMTRYYGRPPARIDDPTYYGAATPWGGPDLEPLGLREIVPPVDRAAA